MKTKKHRWFLWCSLVFWGISVVIFLTEIVLSYYELKTMCQTLSPNDIIRFEYSFVIAVFGYIVVVFPVLLVELSCIRSVYKILKYEPKGIVKICYIVSAAMAFAAFVFFCLVAAGVVDLVDESGDAGLQHNMLLITEWPVFIISFILGSIRKRKDKCGFMLKHSIII